MARGGTWRTVAASVLSGLYWLAFFLVAESLLASDFGPGPAPPTGQLRVKAVAVLTCGVAVYALLVAAWRRFT